jgi:SAM-dependent methyltransferase
MSSLIFRRETCRLCGSRDLELVFQLAPSPIGDAYVSADRVDQVQDTYPIDLFLCRNCGLSQLLDVIAPEILYGDYIYVTSSSLGLVEHFQRYADEVLRRINPPAGALIVDIGSNDGTLLGFFQQCGMQVLGIDPAREIAQKATAAGIETLPEFCTPAIAHQIRQARGSAAIITANNVFANIDDLTTMTEGIRDLLAPDGVFVFESFYLADLIQNMVFDFIYHEHLSAFAVMPTQSFFRRMGMQLIDVKPVPTKGGSLRYTVQLDGGPRRVDPSVASMIEFEKSFGLYQPETFKDFAARVDALKVQTVRLLRDLKAQGKTIAGFGASITVTTLIYHFGIGGLLDYLVDDNPAKQERFSPGLHLAVFAPPVLYERKPNYVVVLAWRYVEPIVKKHIAFLEQGGHFIVPVPEVKVI